MDFRSKVLALVVVGLTQHPAAAIAERVLTTDGLGAVRIGMSVSQIERALGARVKPDPKEASEPCWFAVRADGTDPSVGYMIELGRVTRIDVFVPLSGVPTDVVAQGNVGIGSSMGDVRRAYGRVPRGRLSDSNPGHVEINVVTKANRTIVISMVGDRMESFRAGLVSSAAYPEGCS